MPTLLYSLNRKIRFLALIMFGIICLYFKSSIGKGAYQMTGEKTRVLVLTDISSLSGNLNEPDDTQSLVRLLLYADQFQIEGLIATYTEHCDDVKPEYIEEVVKAYGKVRDNLLLHSSSYPREEELLKVIKSGSKKCGMGHVGPGWDTEASDWIIKMANKPDLRPLWILVWGGPLDLAQALWKVTAECGPSGAAKFKERLRVYAIGDQYDESGKWIRQNHPDLFYITSYKAFRGIYRYGDTSLCSERWVVDNISTNHGPLGKIYPVYDGGDPWGRVKGIKEGDTPTFLYLVRNGLGCPEKPWYGSWGGRFEGRGNHFYDAVDAVGNDASEAATLYRWRPAFQADFQARMDWCVKSYENANHAPRAEIKGDPARRVKPGEKVILSAEDSTDPDGDDISYKWYCYREAGNFAGEPEIEGSDEAVAVFTAPHVNTETNIHIILEVTDNGEPPLTSYKRVIVTVDPNLK